MESSTALQIAQRNAVAQARGLAEPRTGRDGGKTSTSVDVTDGRTSPLRHVDAQLSRTLVLDVRQRNVALAQSMSGLESAISRPGMGRMLAWELGVGAAIDDLRAALLKHVEICETSGSLLDLVIERHPNLTSRASRLRRDHSRAHRLVHDVYVALDGIPDESMLDDVRERATELLLHLVHHRQRSADLMWEAFNIDVTGN